ncbi:MAG TPA: protein translocase subunit SecD [Gemmatimonadaceae bacterium]
MHNLKMRVLLIVGLLAISAWTLRPRPVIELKEIENGERVPDTVSRAPIKLGLDLLGGMHLALEVDESKGAVADKSEALDRALTVVRERIDEFGVAEPLVQKVGEDRIIVELPGIDDPERAIEVVQKSAFLQFQIVDESNALDRVLPRLDQIVRERGVAVAAAPAAGQGRTGAGALGNLFADDTTEADSAGTDSLALGATAGPLSSLLAQGQMPGQYFVSAADYPTVERYLTMPEVRAALPPGKVVRWQNDTTMLGAQPYRALYVLDSRPIMTGQYLTDAQAGTDPLEGTRVTFELNNEGGRRFRTETQRHVRDFMAIVLDDRVMGFPPVIQSAIGTNGQITLGGKTLQEAQDLALVLRAGALPVALRIIEVRQIGASLGEDAIRQGIQAGLLGLALVIIIMVVYYRFSGMLAVAGLVFYAITTLAFLASVGATLTLPGIAGFILSIGMAVDANFLQFERIREEMAAGKTPRLAIEEGFRNSFSAIVDTHVTTAITALVLMQFGTGPVQGFAVTLLAGVASSMVSSVFVVRTLFLLWLKRSRGAQTLSI